MRDSCAFKYRGPPFTGASTVEEAAAGLSRYAGTVVVKWGREGTLARAGEQVWKAPSFEVEVMDTTGAGDAFNAGFMYAHIVEGRPMPNALRFANACGAIAVTTIGGPTAPPSAGEVDAFIKERSDLSLNEEAKSCSSY
jgi:sugar/nucleoside kinase (ribokinase family)